MQASPMQANAMQANAARYVAATRNGLGACGGTASATNTKLAKLKYGRRGKTRGKSNGLVTCCLAGWCLALAACALVPLSDTEGWGPGRYAMWQATMCQPPARYPVRQRHELAAPAHDVGVLRLRGGRASPSAGVSAKGSRALATKTSCPKRATHKTATATHKTASPKRAKRRMVGDHCGADAEQDAEQDARAHEHAIRKDAINEDAIRKELMSVFGDMKVARAPPARAPLPPSKAACTPALLAQLALPFCRWLRLSAQASRPQDRMRLTLRCLDVPTSLTCA